jgi:hypothetical protein
MSRPKIERRIKRILPAIAAAIAVGGVLAGCSDIYYARRDSIALSAGDAIAANEVEQMFDPWPPHSGNTGIAFNGQKMQSAVERYRTDAVTPPVDPLALQVANPSATPPQNGNSQGSNNQSNSSSGAPAPSGSSQ